VSALVIAAIDQQRALIEYQNEVVFFVGSFVISTERALSTSPQFNMFKALAPPRSQRHFVRRMILLLTLWTAAQPGRECHGFGWC
jgi:hypothetical protein